MLNAPLDRHAALDPIAANADRDPCDQAPIAAAVAALLALPHDATPDAQEGAAEALLMVLLDQGCLMCGEEQEAYLETDGFAFDGNVRVPGFGWLAVAADGSVQAIPDAE